MRRMPLELRVCLESYKEGDRSTVTHNGIDYKLDPIFEMTHDRSISEVPLDKLTWILKYSDLDPKRVAAAAPSVPIIVLRDHKAGHTGQVVIDGIHRLAKAEKEGLKTIPVRYVTQEEIEPYAIKK